MADPRDPFGWLRETAERSSPTSEQREYARRRLQQVINTEGNAVTQPAAPRWLYIAVVAAGMVVVMVLLPLASTDPAQAALAEVANAARHAAPDEVPDSAFVYTRSEGVNLVAIEGDELSLERGSVAYLLPVTRETWASATELFIAIRSEVGTPIFFDSEVEDAYYDAGHDEIDQVGEVVVEQLRDVSPPIGGIDWPTDPTELKTAIEETLSDNGVTPTDSQVFDIAVDFLRESSPDPKLRSAILQVLATLPLELLDETSTTLTVGSSEGGQRTTITLSTTGDLIAERIVLTEDDPELGLDAGTVVSRVEYEEQRIIASLPPDLGVELGERGD